MKQKNKVSFQDLYMSSLALIKLKKKIIEANSIVYTFDQCDKSINFIEKKVRCLAKLLSEDSTKFNFIIMQHYNLIETRPIQNMLVIFIKFEKLSASSVDLSLLPITKKMIPNFVGVLDKSTTKLVFPLFNKGIYNLVTTIDSPELFFLSKRFNQLYYKNRKCKPTTIFKKNKHGVVYLSSNLFLKTFITNESHDRSSKKLNTVLSKNYPLVDDFKKDIYQYPDGVKPLTPDEKKKSFIFFGRIYGHFKIKIVRKRKSYKRCINNSLLH